MGNWISWNYKRKANYQIQWIGVNAVSIQFVYPLLYLFSDHFWSGSSNFTELFWCPIVAKASWADWWNICIFFIKSVEKLYLPLHILAINSTKKSCFPHSHFEFCQLQCESVSNDEVLNAWRQNDISVIFSHYFAFASHFYYIKW